MLRKVVQINEDLCVGCSACVNTCLQSAIAMVDGKAKVISQSSCDGLERCLPMCPTDAISFVEKEVDVDVANTSSCPSTQTISSNKSSQNMDLNLDSNIQTWPLQIQLVMEQAPFLNDCDLLIAADCAAFAHPSFNASYMANKVCLIGCPKLDIDYTEKLSNIFKLNNIKSIQLVKMSVPCCSGLDYFIQQALIKSGKDIDYKIVTIDTNGKELS